MPLKSGHSKNGSMRKFEGSLDARVCLGSYRDVVGIKDAAPTSQLQGLGVLFL